MKTAVSSILLLFFFFSQSSYAQFKPSLNDGFDDSYFYKINNKQALDVLMNHLKPTDTTVFNHLVYVQEKYSDSLPLTTGNYLKINFRGNKVAYEYYPVTPWRVYILDNKEDLIVQFLDLKTKLPVKLGKVAIGKKAMNWDENIKAYILKHNKRTGILSVYQEETFYFSVSKENSYNDYNYPKVSLDINRILYKSPLKYIGRPLRFYSNGFLDGIYSVANGHQFGTIADAVNYTNKIWHRFSPSQKYNESNYYHSHYFYFSKPIYRPHDTIKFKAYILNNKEETWYEKPLMVFLEKTYHKEIYLGNVTSNGKGAGYSYQFTIADSMDIDLDKSYYLRLKDSDSNTIASDYFKYEDYELKKAVFEVNLKDGHEQYRNKPFGVDFIAKDENGLPMPDTRASIFILTKEITNVKPDQLFVPDTLWTYTANITKGNETIIIPDSIFPIANVEYKLKAILQNSENEYEELNRDIEYRLKPENLKIELLKNNLLITQQAKGEEKIRVYGEDYFDIIVFDTLVTAPFSLPVNNQITTYYAETNEDDAELEMNETESGVFIDYNVYKDSIVLNLVNPKNLPIVYHIYKGNSAIKQGTEKDFPFVINSDEKSLYYTLAEYIWAGKTKSETNSIYYPKNQIRLNVEQPSNITPGKETVINITGTDIEGAPIKDLNLLAYSFTNKLQEDRTPRLPNLGYRFKSRTANNSFELDDSYETKNTSLNFNFWNTKMLLDTNWSYRFRYPSKDSIEYTTIAMKDSITQIAPFVMKNGAMQAVQYVYIDNIPVYFGFTDKKLPYSFEVDSNVHEIKIRTNQELITIKDIKFQPYVKTIFSIDQGQLNNSLFRTQQMPDSFTRVEKDMLYRCIMSLNMNSADLKYAYLERAEDEGECLNVSNNNNYRNQPQYFIIGPVYWRYWNFRTYEGTYIPFEYEPYYTYSFGNNLIKMKSNKLEHLPRMLFTNYAPDINDVFPTKKRTLDFYDQQIFEGRSSERFDSLNKQYTGSGNLVIDQNKKYGEAYPANIILGKPDDFNFIRIYPGNAMEFNNIPAGKYQLLLIDKYNYYRKTDIIEVKENGTTFYRIKQTDTIKDRSIIRINQLLNQFFLSPEDKRPINLNLLMSEYVNATYQGASDIYSGVVLDNDKEGIPGASIKIAGTNIGTMTDVDGKFEIRIPAGTNPSLEISSMGSETTTVMATKNMKITLERGANVLAEVVIATPYGPPISKGKYVGAADVITGSLSYTDITKALEGAAPGVQVTDGGGQPGSGSNLRIRGFGPLSSNSSPLIVIDGAIFNGDIKSIDPSIIGSINILKDATSTSLYGSRGVNGVIVLTTKNGAVLPESIRLGLQEIPPPMAEDMMVSSLRNNFKDDAYWQPDLVTDENGKATFKVKFPDDITNWKTFVIATDDKKHTGYVIGNIKSYKPVAASLYLPHFLLDGDSALLIGKSVNYIPDTIPATTTFFQNDVLQKENKIHLGPFYNDTLLVTNKGADSIKLKYLLTKEDGYFDGEEKTIPLQRVGIKIAEGGFVSLDKKDTSFTIYPTAKGDTLHLSATASLIDVLLDEIDVVRNYGYMCNEQKASKILAFLAKQKIYASLQKTFGDKDRRYVQGLIDKIIKSQNNAHQWGWWDEGPTIPWISNHVLKTLLQAKAMGYNVNIDTKVITDNYIFNLERDTTYVDISTLQMLAECGVSVNYEKYISRLERNKDLSLNTLFELILLRQKLHLHYKLDKLIAMKETDIFGNVYWKDTSRYVYSNEVLTTLNAFKIIQNDTSTGIPSSKIINWLIQQRTVSGWRNTYESSNIIEVLATSIPLGNKDALKPVLMFNGCIDEKIEKFPYKKGILLGSALQIQKSGYAPVYFSWYYNKWDTSNTNSGNNFRLQSDFESNGKNISTLPAGVPVTMKVKVKVEKSAEFVMIEIPIPAGCSYQSKEQFYSNYEIHREYFEDKVSIFCEKLPKGDYEYTVELLPRFQGSYTLNPAKAELMYFPVFYGREKIKRVAIRE
ncbi:TonB-dependent receptor plug domain-containing protein [Taibaiella lutea]|uniref:TonB-dependent receptor plug domain-containing protein n=1 Tax=Taibaiella lutea TaxID=2608001 RepID=A0A5M6CIR5_9BACT|nr:TonB-dependent receptor plug domain-containing protein [Taibaiella lutea]KAA5535091.1 TonB-dependent receptor plug domain-containing protein [Taibaiella lutea]